MNLKFDIDEVVLIKGRVLEASVDCHNNVSYEIKVIVSDNVFRYPVSISEEDLMKYCEVDEDGKQA